MHDDFDYQRTLLYRWNMHIEKNWSRQINSVEGFSPHQFFKQSNKFRFPIPTVASLIAHSIYNIKLVQDLSGLLQMNKNTFLRKFTSFFMKLELISCRLRRGYIHGSLWSFRNFQVFKSRKKKKIMILKFIKYWYMAKAYLMSSPLLFVGSRKKKLSFTESRKRFSTGSVMPNLNGLELLASVVSRFFNSIGLD